MASGSEHKASYYYYLGYYLDKVGGKFILQCHFDCRNLPISMLGFYKDCLDAWSILTEKEVCLYEDIMNQLLWNKNTF